MPLRKFREIVVVDTEFVSLPGERPAPVCIVGRQLRSGRSFRLLIGQYGTEPPWAVGPDVLMVAFLNSAEFGVYKVINWQLPQWTLDLFIEFRRHTNGKPLQYGAGLLGALAYFGLEGMDPVRKKHMQTVIGNNTWRQFYTPQQVIDYCARDVDEEPELLLKMLAVIPCGS